MTARPQPQVFVVKFTVPRGVDGIKLLRRFLKVAKQAFGLRCIDYEEKRR
jgi:hypothetical protein